MIVTAVDSNVLIDVLFGDNQFAQTSASSLSQCSREGTVVISTVVMAEVASYFAHATDAVSFFDQTRIAVSDFGVQSAMEAGQLWRDRVNKDRSRILPDYMVAAHAVTHADRLLTRDTGFNRMGIPGLVVVTPTDLMTAKPDRE